MRLQYFGNRALVRVLITGSREWAKHPPLLPVLHELIRRALYELLSQYEARDIILIHGGAAGADRIAHRTAKSMGLPDPEVHTLTDEDWDRQGNSAGPLRNIAMLETGVSLVLAFRLGGLSSRGTTQCISEALKRRIPVITYDWALPLVVPTGQMELV